jgi:hypothetical protein
MKPMKSNSAEGKKVMQFLEAGGYRRRRSRWNEENARLARFFLA